MVNLKELGMFENDMEIAVSREAPDFNECKRIMTEQQKYMQLLVAENEKLREYILDEIIYQQ